MKTYCQILRQCACALTASSPKNGREIQIIACETSKMHLLQTYLLWTLNFDDSPFLSQQTWERVIYLKRKLCIVANECSFDIGKIPVMRAYEIKRVPANLYGSPCTPLIPLQTRISIFRNPKTKILCEREILATLSVPRNTNSKYLFSFLYISLF